MMFNINPTTDMLGEPPLIIKTHSGDDVRQLLQVQAVHLVSRQTLRAFREQTQTTGCREGQRSISGAGC